ncbi:DUF1033 family protein [Siminovitchia acidinfaciens]|uniref:DUF1033 family protein n=1 Tax=Siminovitchia acidinfaciens TaxID=2321395 RepID=A0A429XX86_9BACI|nr:DUF1033 family protein [Siminovitchia acidinfaciens]RST73118.1 DUF1033 family protein [Siminovitchia acidinfaciens]VEF48223.1 Uncharacterized protein conserved in bacteria [Bacillus freudenreichii]
MVQNWEVIVMKGDSEPWWFFPEWRNDIIEMYTYSDSEAAIQKYFSLFRQLKEEFEQLKVKKTSLAAFWNKEDVSFCEHCDEDLQLYYGLLILLNGEPYQFPDSGHLANYEKREIK